MSDERGDAVSSSDGSGGDRSTPKRVLRWTAAGLAVAVLLTWIAVVTGFGMGTVVPFALHRFAPEGWTVEVGRVEGRWLHRMALTDLSVDGPTFDLEVPELLLRYRLRPLMDKRLEIDEMVVSSPSVRVLLPDTARAEEADSSGSTLLRLMSGRSVGEWSARVVSARLTGGQAEIRSAGEERYAITGLEIDGGGGLGAEGLTVRVDTLGGAFVSVLAVPADSLFRSEGTFTLVGELAGGTLSLDTLSVSSDYSRVAGGGRLTLMEGPEVWSDAAFELSAQPFDLRDLPVALPDPLMAEPDVFVRLTAAGAPDSVQVAFDGRMLGGGTTTQGEAVVRRTAAHRPALEGSFSVAGLDPAPWLSSSSFAGRVSGSADVTLSSLASGASYTAAGSLRHEPRTLDPSRLAHRPLTARFDIGGSLPDTTEGGRDLVAEVDVDLAVERPTARLGTLRARIEGSEASVRTELRLASGSVEGSGRVAWGSELRASVDGLRFRALDLAAVDTLFPGTSLTGTIVGQLRGASTDALRGTVDLALGSSSFREVEVDTVRLTSGVRGRTFDADLFAVSDLGEVRSRQVVELVDSVVRFDVREVAYVRPDSAAADVPLGELYGRAVGSWTLSETPSGRLRAEVDSARWGPRGVRDALVDARLQGERIDGEAELTATGVLPDPVRIVGRAAVSGLAPAAATGTVAFSAARASSDASARADTVHVEIEAEEPGRFRLDGILRPAEGGELELDGTGRASGDSLAFDVQAAGSLGSATALLGGTALDSIHVTASGRRVGDDWQEARGQVVLGDVRWNRVHAERALATLHYDSTGFVVDTLDVRSNVFTAFGKGHIPAHRAGGSIDITARVVDLDPLREMGDFDVLAAGDGTLEASVGGTLDSLDWRADLDLEALVVNQLRMTGVAFDGEGVLAAPYDFLFGLSSSDMTLSFNRILLPQSEVRSVRFGASGGADSLRVQAEAEVDDSRRATALVHVDPRPEGRTARIEDIRFQIDEDQWRLANQAVLRYGSGVSVEPVLLRAGEQEIRFEGGVSESGDLDLNARMDSTDVATVADLVGLPRLRGWLSGRLRVQGTTDSPEAWLDVNGALHRQGRRPGPVQVRVRGNGRRVRGDIELLDANQGALRLTGGGLMPGVGRGDDVGTPSLAAMTSAAPDEKVFGLVSDSLDVSVEANAFDLRWTEAFFTADMLSSIAGRLDGSIRLEGSSTDPDLSGEIRLSDGSAYPTALGVRYDVIRMTVRGAGRDLVVDSARISGSSGVATASGTVAATGNMPLDLTVGLDGFRAIRTDAYWAVVSGSLGVDGVVMAPVIGGDLRLEALDVFLDERVTSGGLEPVELTEEDLRMLRERFGIVPDATQARRPLAERLTADLSVELGRDSWLRKRTSPEMAVPFSGTIQVEMRPGQPPFLQGSVDVIAGRGYVEQFGRRFNLSEGTVTFSGTPAETRVDLEATYTIPSRDNPDDAEVTIILEVAGTQEDLSLTLSSEPTLENADIVSYIATGRPAAGSLSFEGRAAGGGLVAAGADYALSQMTSLIESAAAGSVGLDVVEIRREGLRQATLVAGKYVTPRLYVGFAQPISLQEGTGLSSGSEGRSELEIEYEAWRWLLLNIEGSGSSVRFFLRGRRAY